MKRNIYFSLLTAVIVIFTSCAKPQEQLSVRNLTIKAVNPQFRSTTHDGVNVLWDNSDQIALFAGSADEKSAIFTTNLTTSSSSAVFVHTNDTEPVKQGNCYQAVFPASQLYKWNSAGNRACAADLPFEQKVSSPGWDKRASLMAASSATDEFVFSHCVAYIRFTIDKDSP